MKENDWRIVINWPMLGVAICISTLQSIYCTCMYVTELSFVSKQITAKIQTIGAIEKNPVDILKLEHNRSPQSKGKGVRSLMAVGAMGC